MVVDNIECVARSGDVTSSEIFGNFMRCGEGALLMVFEVPRNICFAIIPFVERFDSSEETLGCRDKSG